MTYNFQYFHDQKLLRQNLDFENNKNVSEFDILIDQLNYQEIYNYYDVDWAVFADVFIPRISKSKDTNKQPQFDIRLEQVCNHIVNREVVLKLLLFFQKNVHDIWYGWGIDKEIETECARLISENIKGSVRDEYHGRFAEMPRLNYAQWIQDPNIFIEKTPTEKWIEEKQKEMAESCICDFRFMSPRFFENSNYCERWLYKSPNSKFSFNYEEVALGIYELIQTEDIIEYTKYIRTYLNNHPEFNIADTNDCEEFYHEVRNLVILMVEAFFNYSSPGGCWGISGVDFPNMTVTELEEKLKIPMWLSALNKLQGDSKTIIKDHSNNTLSVLENKVATKTKTGKAVETLPFSHYFREDLTEEQRKYIDKEIRVACGKKCAGVAVANVLSDFTNRSRYLAITDVQDAELYRSLADTYQLKTKLRAFSRAMHDFRNPPKKSTK